MVVWSPAVAYAVGLIASDGCMRSDGRHVVLTSADRELIEKYKQAIGLTNKISESIDRDTQKVSCYYINSAQKVWYQFLTATGIFPSKSKTIGPLQIPDFYFVDFIRGLFDGDGTSYSFKDPRYPNALNIYIEFATASICFAEWIKERLRVLYGIKAIIKNGKGVYIVRLFKGDSRLLFAKMYGSSDALFLKRKYAKMKRMFEEDDLMAVFRKR